MTTFYMVSTSLLVLFLSIIMVNSQWQLEPTTCQTIFSQISASHDDARTSVTCPSGFTLVGCTACSWFKNLDGSWIDGDTCWAQNGNGGNGVYAIAQCCNIHATCVNAGSQQSGSNVNDEARAHCPADHIMTGCTQYTWWNHLNGGSADVSVNTCIGLNGPGGWGAWANARCCKSDPNYKLSCHARYDWQLSGTGDDNSVSIKCTSPYFLTGCMAKTENDNLDGAVFDATNNRCHAQNGHGGSGVNAIAICCAEERNTAGNRRLVDRLDMEPMDNNNENIQV